MNAVISGRAGLALLIDGESLMSLDVDDLETLVPRRPYDLRFLLADATDLVTLENTGREEIAQRLDLEHDIACALDMTLIGLDAAASMELRMEAIETLDELLADARIIKRLEFTMYAKPLPDSVDLIGALFCTEGTTAAARSFFERLSQYQTAIGVVREAWDTLPDLLFGNEPTDKAVFHNAVCREGLFRLLALSYGDQAKVSSIVFGALKSTSTIGSFPNHREIIERWCAPMRDAVRSVEPEFGRQADDYYEDVAEALQDSESKDRRGEPADVRLQDFESQRDPILVADRSEQVYVNGAVLVRQIILADPCGEEEIVRRYRQGVSAIIDQIVRSPSATEDVSQETFRIVLEKLRRGDLREPERLSGFVCSVARNSAIDYIRRARRFYHREEINAEHIPDPTPSQFDDVFKQERAGVVHQIINELKTERDRELLHRYYIAEEDRDRICLDLGLTRIQFNNVIYRTLARFKELYIKLVEEP